jgi:putative oxidoreductase
MEGIKYMAALGRILMAAVFLISGFIHILPAQETIRAPIAVITQPEWAFYVATGVEILGGLFLALGLATRYVALLMAIFTLAISVGPNFGNYADFLKNLAIAGGLIQIWSFGSGGLALTHSRPR